VSSSISFSSWKVEVTKVGAGNWSQNVTICTQLPNEIKGEEIGWIMMSSDYYGVHLKSDDVEIHKVYHVDMQKWIYEVEGEYFDIISDFGPKPDYYITFYKQNEVKQNEEI
jgi:hypothetical protein